MESKGDNAVFVSFMEEVAHNWYCWPETPLLEAVGQEQIFLKGFPAERKEDTITFPSINEIQELFMPCHEKLVAAKRRMMVGD